MSRKEGCNIAHVSVMSGKEGGRVSSIASYWSHIKKKPLIGGFKQVLDRKMHDSQLSGSLLWQKAWSKQLFSSKEINT